MTPSEKAKELVEKFDCMECDKHWDLVMTCDHIAKQCAIICVDEILGTIRTGQDYDPSFWQQVKEEIQKL